MTRHAAPLVVLFLALQVLTGTVQSQPMGQAQTGDWCGTMPDYRRHIRLTSRSATRGESDCPTGFAPDVPATRNAAIPSANTPIKLIRLKLHVFANDDGSSPAATPSQINAMAEDINADFRPSRLQFVISTAYHNSTHYRHIDDPLANPADAATLKAAYAAQPSAQLNIYITDMAGFNGVATFPWDARALTAQGGLLLDDNRAGPGYKTVSHEIGHCLGLWHVHKGTDEIVYSGETLADRCGRSCAELAGRSAAQGDVTGDFCADTPATPVNFTCSDPGGTDPCNNVAWGWTNPSNYMGYGVDTGCRNNFTPQQMGRMHAWIKQSLSGWLTTDTAKPTVTITNPAHGSLVQSVAAISGTAQDSVALDRVALAIIRLNGPGSSDDQSWNGTTWAGGVTILPTSYNSASHVWQSTAALPSTNNANPTRSWTSGTYQFVAVAYDRAGHEQRAESVVTYRASFTWTGATLRDGNPGNDNTTWGTPQNWSPVGIPGLGDVATIANGDTVNSSSSRVVYGLNLSAGVLNFTNSCTMTATGVSNWSGGAFRGIWRNEAGATLNIAAAARKDIGAGGVINNAGTVTWSGAGNIYNHGAGGTATFNNLFGGTFNARSSGIFDQTSGKSVFRNGGTLNIGVARGILNLNWNYVQTRTGVLNIEMSGVNAAIPAFDQLKINGSATLDGTLNVVLLNGFTPAQTSSFTIITHAAGARTGAFAAVNDLNPGDGRRLNPGYNLDSVTLVTGREPVAPNNAGLSPGSGSSAAGAARVFTATYADANGAADISFVHILINGSVSGTSGLWAYYDCGGNRLYLRNDTNTAWLGGFAPGGRNADGSPRTISNSQGILNCGGTTVSRAGNITVNWNFIPAAKWAGTSQNLYLYLQDKSRLSDGWDQMGTWTITGAP